VWWVTVASAGVWVRDEGAGYVQASVGHARAEQMYLADGSLVPQTDPALLGHLAPLFDETGFALSDVALYGEYGLGRGIEVSGSVPVRAASRRYSFASGSWPDVVNRNVGLGDLALGARLGLVRSGWAVSGGLVARAPLYDNAPATLNVEAGNSDLEDDRVPLGQGTYELEAIGGFGRGFGRGWALVEVGARIRNRQYSAITPGRIQVGLTPVPGVSAWVGADWAVSLGNGEAPDLFRDRWGKGPLVVDHQRYVAGSVGASVRVAEGLSVLATASRTLAAARFPLLTSASLGASWTFRRRAGPSEIP
jgi:hypothetical protein